MHIRAYLMLTTTTLCWAGNAVAGKLAAGHVSPFLLTTMRWALAASVLIVFALPHIRRDWSVIRKNLPLLAAYGAFGFTGFNVLFYLSLNYTTAINVGILQGSMPLLIFMLNLAIFRTAISTGQIIGFSISLLGVIVTATRGDLSTLLELAFNYGDLLMLMAVLLYGSYTVTLRWKPKLHWLSFITIAAISAFIASLPFTAWEYHAGEAIAPDAVGWAVAVYIAIFPAILAQVFYIMAIDMISSNRAGMFTNLNPVFGTMLAVLILGEELHPYVIVALALVIGGVAIAERFKPAPVIPAE